VTIYNLHVASVTTIPSEADTPLVVDPYAVLPRPIRFERLQPVDGRNPEIVERFRGVQEL